MIHWFDGRCSERGARGLRKMGFPDRYTETYEDMLEGTYDCVDRFVLNAHFRMAQSGGGFRVWWRSLTGGDETLDDTHLMRPAGRFSRRVRAFAKKRNIPLVRCSAGERKPEIAAEYLPSDPGFRGLFCILVGRARGSVLQVQRYGKGGINVRRRKHQPLVNFYYFHIIDPEWGHVIIRFCPHPPFDAQFIFNGHERLARAADAEGILYRKERNCFTEISSAADLARVADTMSTAGAEGRLAQVCERWIYSVCLIFALDREEQERTNFRYSYSVYQVEYSRNLLFRVGAQMEKVLQNTIDRTRARLDLKTVKTIFGFKKRPRRRSASGRPPRLEANVENPDFDLTVFKIHFGNLTVRVYCKGDHVLRFEAVTHNVRDLRCRRDVAWFHEIVERLRRILDRFLAVLSAVDASFVEPSVLNEWPRPTESDGRRTPGIDPSSPRMRAVLEAVLELASTPNGFKTSALAARVRRRLRLPEGAYTTRHASYDLKKLRAKNLVSRVPRRHRCEPVPDGLRAIAAFLTIQDKILVPLLARDRHSTSPREPHNPIPADTHYENIRKEMLKIFQTYGIAA
jgi:hypothetical protein